jgi:hypothetical protein
MVFSILNKHHVSFCSFRPGNPYCENSCEQGCESYCDVFNADMPDSYVEGPGSFVLTRGYKNRRSLLSSDLFVSVDHELVCSYDWSTEEFSIFWNEKWIAHTF